MKPPRLAVRIAVLSMLAGCAPAPTLPDAVAPYLSPSRFTDPGEGATMLDAVPDDALGIARVARNLTVHHNLLAHLEIPKEDWPGIPRVWPPRAPDILSALAGSGPGDLLGRRQVTDRVRGACMLESHLLASMLRHRGIPVRLRAGYFRNVYTNEDHLVAFWEKNSRVKGVAAELLEQDPEKWLKVNHEHTRQQVAVDKRVEHWIAQYWDGERNEWRLLDANTTFLKAMSDIEVDFHLPRRYFEFAWESWRKMRTDPNFNPDQYAEWPQDGRSHIRSQLLWDFYSLLNHDIAGLDKTQPPERETYAFVKETRYEEVSREELSTLDALADLLSREPGVEELVTFYHGQERLRLPTPENDPYSFVADGPRR